MTIGELAAKTGLQTSAIRYYEKVGLLAAPSRMSGRRIYQTRAVNQLLVIALAKKLGFKLNEIRLLLHNFPEGTAPSLRWNKLAKTKIAEIEVFIVRAQAIKEMLEAVVQCRCHRLEDCAQSLRSRINA